MKPLPRKSPVVIPKNRVQSAVQTRFILESNESGRWCVVKRFVTQDELVAAIGSKPHLRGRASMPKLKWKFFYPRGGEDWRKAA